MAGGEGAACQLAADLTWRVFVEPFLFYLFPLCPSLLPPDDTFWLVSVVHVVVVHPKSVVAALFFFRGGGGFDSCRLLFP